MAFSRTKKLTAEEALSMVFNLANDYANQDETMRGSENIRNYHYYNALNKVMELVTGKYRGR